jgi:NAD(P)-dependent dehydrogenase (short-subunit alcohol dehydrogenase family)
MSMEGKVVIVTGAGSGIGRALAIGFAKDDANVVGFDINGAGLDETGRAYDGRIETIQGDVSSEEDVDRLVAVIREQIGRIDVLFNNAAISDRSPMTELPFEAWARVIQVNLIGVALCTHRILPIMLRQGYGRIINVVSRNAESHASRRTAYCSSKAGVVTLTKNLAGALKQDGYTNVLVNSMIPGPTRTPIWGSALIDGTIPEELTKQLQDADAVYPHARFLVELPPGGPSGRVFWNSEEYRIYEHFND